MCDHHGTQVQIQGQAVPANPIGLGSYGSQGEGGRSALGEGSGEYRPSLLQVGDPGGQPTASGGPDGAHSQGGHPIFAGAIGVGVAVDGDQCCGGATRHRMALDGGEPKRRGARRASARGSSITIEPASTTTEDEVSCHRSFLPKMSFPKFIGENPRIWIDKCHDYFRIFNIPECMWTTAVSLHMEDNVAKWFQVYKLKAGLGDWRVFVAAVEEKFGAFYYMKAVHDLLGIR
jgi:hypothetical protein